MRTRPHKLLAGALSLGIGLACSLAESEAAVRLCRELVTATQSAATELDARRLAMAEWKAATKKYSPHHDLWRLAAHKTLACGVVDGGYECLARGSPCVISQVVPTRPPVDN